MQKKIKFISVFAAFGFLISLICGLCSKSKFYIVAVKALGFAVVFGLLALLISFLFDKFLNDDSASDISGDETDNHSANQTARPVEHSSKGHNVDFVVQDEEFEKDDSDNHFVVGDNHQMLNTTDIANSSVSKNEQNAKEDNSNFVPLKNFETVENFSSKEAVSPKSVESVSAPMESISDSELKNDSEKNIDTLPDMSSLGFDNVLSNSNNSEDDDVEVEGTDDTFSSSVSSSYKSRNDVDIPEVKNASLMAKAISSILSNEDS